MKSEMGMKLKTEVFIHDAIVISHCYVENADDGLALIKLSLYAKTSAVSYSRSVDWMIDATAAMPDYFPVSQHPLNLESADHRYEQRTFTPRNSGI